MTQKAAYDDNWMNTNYVTQNAYLPNWLSNILDCCLQMIVRIVLLRRSRTQSVTAFSRYSP